MLRLRSSVGSDFSNDRHSNPHPVTGVIEIYDAETIRPEHVLGRP